jgi:hypothetical protein|tara:strand:- start:1631 stop:2563 length:933 start_codon:yes stop_codon:yes gene_type:complete
MSIFSGGGGGGGGGSTTGTQTTIAREAPGVEARKLALYDEAANLAKSPVGIPGVQVAPLSAIEQAGITQAGQTGVGAGAVTSGIGAFQGAPTLANQYASGATQMAANAPNIGQFLNPYQQYVTNEIGRQGQIAQNQLSASAIDAGAFGGGRQGVQQAELQNRTLQAMGQAQAQGFNTALSAAQQQQALGTQTQLSAGQLASNVGLAAAQGLGQLGGQQQAMSLADINAQMQAGAVQRGIGQQALDAQRATQLQRAYEPYQRVEFLKGIMTNLPTTQSSVTATTAPGSNPLSQAVGTGLAGYAAYNMMQPR